MRHLVLSDVHGNVHALRAVLDAVRGESFDAVLCLGDLVGYGPAHDECVEMVRDLGAVTVAGNHDLIALGTLSQDRCGPLARETSEWTRAALSERTREYLAGLPLHTRLGDVLLAHGSIDDPQEYVRSGERADALLATLSREHPDCGVLLLGHTHQPWAYTSGRGTLLRGPRRRTVRLAAGARHLLNPGSVGQSRDRTVAARYLVLDTGRGEARFEAVAYDVDAHVAALRRAGLPDRSHQMRPRPRDQVMELRWAAGRKVRRLAGRTLRHRGSGSDVPGTGA